MGVKDVESGVMFHRTHGNRRTGKKEFEISDEYVKLQGKSQGIVVINFRASKEDLVTIYEFFDDVDDMEPVTMNIANTGDIEHYFKGISPISQEDESGTYKFSVTMQTLRKSV